MTRKPGRPRSGPVALSANVGGAVTPAERDAVLAAANADGVTVSQWVRRAVVAQLIRAAQE